MEGIKREKEKGKIKKTNKWAPPVIHLSNFLMSPNQT
jgi:hypothetical protein